ncbi:hypothetical protein C4587_01415 [Candidatus Parcubacteria bacterium]|nr:MAG: hypothetical protein C4587_01415 [Candidatus Parcubacteria bacterium]
MNSAIGYLAYRFFYRATDFFHHWYADASKNLFHRLFLFLERLDRTIALGITFKYFFHPLYKDYSAVGRILGIVFRSGRILIGLLVYGIVVGAFLVLYAAWVLIPAVILVYVVKRF